MTEVLARIVPASLANTETQAFIVAGLCFIGSWVLIAQIIQIVFSMIWPFLLFVAFITLAPNWTNKFILEVIPEYMQILYGNFKKLQGFFAPKRQKS